MTDALRFVVANARHYSLALWGVRLRVDPPYPHLKRFFPGLIGEPVFEYRTFGALAIWAGVVVWILPAPMVAALTILWFYSSVYRSKFYTSNLAFWGRASKENPFPNRAHARYVEQLLREVERQMKAGEPWEETSTTAAALIDRICAAPAAQDAYFPPQGPGKQGFKR